MTLIEITEQQDSLSFQQRWSHYLVVILGIVGLIIGVNLRDSTLNATTIYTNSQAGIQAAYPQNWLLDEGGDYIFRVRDEAHIGFKTTMQVAARPVSANTSMRNVLDALTLSRSQTLAFYSVLSEEPYTLPDESSATAMSYTYVSGDPNPFLQSVPVVVEGFDILTIKRGQAVVITFLSEAPAYEENLPLFNQFLSNLEF
jgi:hypothetical protein